MSEELIPQGQEGEAPAPGGMTTMWNDRGLMNLSFRMAKMLSTSAFVPDAYRNRPENCLLAIDMANRLGIAPVMAMQNLFIVKGKPAWSGAFCAALVNGCGKFSPLEYVFVGQPGTLSEGCFARSVRLSTGEVCTGTTITLQMAKDEGWLDKAGSKWKTMPRQMMIYRSAAFFARAHCPEVLLGLQTVEEVQDIRGYDEPTRTTVTLNVGEVDANG